MARRRSSARLLLPVAVTGALLAVCAPGAGAHVETDPGRVKPGTTAAIVFTISHGCGGSPTTKVAIRLPAGVSYVGAARLPKGWSVTGPAPGYGSTATSKPAAAPAAVTLAGPGLDAERQQAFALTLKFPTSAGKLVFPTVQTCQKGRQDWISPTFDADYPAPTIEVGGTGATLTTKSSHSH